MRHFAGLTPVISSLVLCLGGCGPNLPETVPVTGKIIFKGQPVTNAQVGFVPQTDAAGALPARGETDANGAFALRTYVAPEAEANGAMPGDYTVTVQKTDVPVDPAALAQMFSKNPGFVPPHLLPAQYGSPVKSPLKFTVVEDGPNSFEIELVDEKKKR